MCETVCISKLINWGHFNAEKTHTASYVLSFFLIERWKARILFPLEFAQCKPHTSVHFRLFHLCTENDRPRKHARLAWDMRQTYGRPWRHARRGEALAPWVLWWSAEQCGRVTRCASLWHFGRTCRLLKSSSTEPLACVMIKKITWKRGNCVQAM